MVSKSLRVGNSMAFTPVGTRSNPSTGVRRVTLQASVCHPPRGLKHGNPREDSGTVRGRTCTPKKLTPSPGSTAASCVAWRCAGNRRVQHTKKTGSAETQIKRSTTGRKCTTTRLTAGQRHRVDPVLMLRTPAEALTNSFPLTVWRSTSTERCARNTFAHSCSPTGQRVRFCQRSTTTLRREKCSAFVEKDHYHPLLEDDSRWTDH